MFRNGGAIVPQNYTMAYSIKAEAGKPDKNGVVKIYALLIYNRDKLRVPTEIKVNKKHWNGTAINSGISKEKQNIIIKNVIIGIEQKLLDTIKFKPDLTFAEAKVLFSSDNSSRSNTYLADFATSLVSELQGKQAKGSIKELQSTIKFLRDYDQDCKLASINTKWMEDFEKYLYTRYSEPNTIWAKIKKTKTIISAAVKKELLPESVLKGYKMPKYKQKLPEYLTEFELGQIESFLEIIQKPGHKLAGYYFLLSAYAGYRISDLKCFDYAKMVTADSIVLKAKKNGSIVSMPIHTRLRKVLDFIKDKPLYLSEPKVREYIREIISFVGIKKYIKVHGARHTFAMLCIDSGIDVYTVSELLGNTLRSTQIYARISNKRIKQEVLAKLG